jgi:HD-like signal output (HDOD) protein
MKRILVVDDEPDFVRALSEIRGALPREWELTFEHDGRGAIEELARTPCDIVVASSRAPRTEVAALLADLKKQHPSTLRLLMADGPLVGESAMLVHDAHDQLPRTIASGGLKGGLLRSCALQDMIHSPGIERLVDRIDALPSVPTLYTEFVTAARDASSTIEDLGNIIGKDPALTARLLQLVNSAAFALPQKIASPGQAATYLGLETLRSLVFSVQAFDAFGTAQSAHFKIERLWEHSLRVAQFSRAILEVERCNRTMIEEGFLAGLLHDCGELVLVMNRPDRFDATRELAQRDGMTHVQLEERLFGASHAAIGGHLIARWGLPVVVVEAIAFHHHPSKFGEADFSPLAAVHVADQLARIDLAHVKPDAIAGIDYGYLKSLGRDTRVARWVQACWESSLSNLAA